MHSKSLGTWGGRFPTGRVGILWPMLEALPLWVFLLVAWEVLLR